MMNRKTLDFDKFMEEKRTEYADVTVFGKTYSVRCKVPAIVPISMARAAENGDNELMGRAILSAGAILFGKETIDELCEKGISIDELGQLIQRTLTMIAAGTVDGDEDDEEEIEDVTNKVTLKGRKSPKK